MRRTSFLLAVVVATINTAGQAAACPFCSVQGQTLAGEVNQADLIVLGSLKNAKQDPTDISKGTTELHIESVIKDHPYLKNKTVLLLPRFIRLEVTPSPKTLVFCGLYSPTKDTVAAGVIGGAILADSSRYQLDPYRGDELEPNSKLPEYLKGAQAIRDKDVVTRLNYYFQSLDSPEAKIAADAYLEFANSDYKDVRAISEKIPADKLLAWLKDPQTPASRFGLYGMMLGHCGKSDHCNSLCAILDDPKKHYSSGLDGLIAGYVMLDPKAGREFLAKLAEDATKDFQVRYAVLRVFRFFWETRPDVLPKDELLKGMKQLVQQADIADLPMEDLRKWEQWSLTDFVLEQGKRESHKQFPIVRRAVLRFALSAGTASPAAVAHIQQMEKEEPERVKLVREMLADEKPKSPPAPEKK